MTLACLQDLAQARARWDREADGFLSLFGTKLVFPGIGDTRTLEAVSLLAGEHEVPTISVTDGPRRRGLAAFWPHARPGPCRCERSASFPSTPSPGACRVACSASRAPSLASLQMTPWYSSSPWRETIRGGLAHTRGSTALTWLSRPDVTIKTATGRFVRPMTTVKDTVSKRLNQGVAQGDPLNAPGLDR